MKNRTKDEKEIERNWSFRNEEKRKAKTQALKKKTKTKGPFLSGLIPN